MASKPYTSTFIVLPTLLMAFTQGSDIRSYCTGESLNATCPPNSVVVMDTSMYGRMRIGRCAGRKGIGCQANTIAIADELCSGKPACEIRVTHPEMDRILTCDKDYTRYLEASFHCQTVLTPNPESCKRAFEISVSRQPGYLSSYVSSQTDCGTMKSPWILHAQPGQRIKITLIDFSYGKSSGHRHSNCKRRYGEMTDLTTDKVEPICGSGERVSEVYMSRGNRLQLTIHKEEAKLYSFLIQFEVFGCPDLKKPHDATLRRDGNTTVVECDGARQTWHLQCVDSQWHGVIGNCTQHLIAVRTGQFKSPEQHFPTEIYMVLIVLASIFLSATIIFIGFVCIKQVTAKDRNMSYDPYGGPHPGYQYPGKGGQDSNYDASLYSRTSQQRNDYMHVQTTTESEAEYQEPTDSSRPHVGDVVERKNVGTNESMNCSRNTEVIPLNVNLNNRQLAQGQQERLKAMRYTHGENKPYFVEYNTREIKSVNT